MGDHDRCPSCGGATLEPPLEKCELPYFSHPSAAMDLLDPPLVKKPGPGFPVHVITVTKVTYEEAADKLGIYPTELEYTIDHGGCGWRGEECIVEGTVTDLGLHSAMFGVWDKGEGGNRLQEQDYRVRGWTQTYPATPNGPEEYDAGIEVVGVDDVEWPEGTEIPFKSDGQFGLPEEGVFVIKHMPDYQAQGASCSQCGHPPHTEGDCDAVVGYDHLNGDHECGCPGEG